MIQKTTECYRVLQSATECYRMYFFLYILYSMSDTDDIQIEDNGVDFVEKPKPKKQKRKCSEARLEQLRKMREKRSENARRKQKEKEVDQFEAEEKRKEEQYEKRFIRCMEKYESRKREQTKEVSKPVLERKQSFQKEEEPVQRPVLQSQPQVSYTLNDILDRIHF